MPLPGLEMRRGGEDDLYQFDNKRELLLTYLEKSARPVFNRFRRCGFNQRTVCALVAQGIDAPEHLLDLQLGDFPSLSPASLEEIERYRSGHIDQWQTRRVSSPTLSPDAGTPPRSSVPERKRPRAG